MPGAGNSRHIPEARVLTAVQIVYLFRDQDFVGLSILCLYESCFQHTGE